MGKSLVGQKAYPFAIAIITLYKKLTNENKEYVLSKQLLRSGTAIGALIREADHAQSKRDFLYKMNIALKEANETQYWLDLLNDTGYINADNYDKLSLSVTEIIKMLASIVKTTKKNLEL